MLSLVSLKGVEVPGLTFSKDVLFRRPKRSAIWSAVSQWWYSGGFRSSRRIDQIFLSHLLLPGSASQLQIHTIEQEVISHPGAAVILGTDPAHTAVERDWLLIVNALCKADV